MANNYGILMPEILIFETLQSFFNIIKKDFAENSVDETKSMLHILFKTDENDRDIKFNTFDYYTQAKSLLIKKSVQVNVGYNLETANMISVHILLPNESGRPMAIGGDENYQPQISETIDGVEEIRPIHTQTFDSTYQLIITSENIFEVLVVYNFLKACFIGMYYHLELMGLRNLKIGGQDVNMQQDSIPTHIFHRTLNMNFFHESNIPDFFRSKLVKDFTSTGIINTNP